jgi:hypothetical protein
LIIIIIRIKKLMGKGRDFLRRICLIALSTNTGIAFAAVVDTGGKLIVGQSRLSNGESGRKDYFPDTSYPLGNLFYLNYLVPTIKKGISTTNVHPQDKSTNMKFQLIHVADESKIAISPLTGSKGKYLCVYLSKHTN